MSHSTIKMQQIRFRLETPRQQIQQRPQTPAGSKGERLEESEGKGGGVKKGEGVTRNGRRMGNKGGMKGRFASLA